MWCKVGDLGDVITGSTPSKSNSLFYGGDYPFYKPTDLEQGINVTTSIDSLSEIGFQNSRQMPPLSVLVTCIGATIGKTGIIRKAGSCNQQINAIIPNGLMCAELIYYFIISDWFQQCIKSNSSATTLPILNKNNFVKLYFPIPPQKEQTRILSFIKSLWSFIDYIDIELFDLRTCLNSTNAKILESAISGKLVPQDPADEPAEELLRRINPSAVPADTSHYGQLPSGWCYTTMDFICQLYDGEKIEDMNLINLDAKYLRGKSEGNTLNKGRFVPEKTTMILVDGENSGEIFTAPIDGYQGSTFKLLDICEEMNAEYVKMIIRIYQKRLRDNKVGSAIPHLNKKMFREILVPVPPIAEQTRIVERTNELMSKITELTEAL